ncbi:hypothetical protein ColLi_08748 [Colletotrichum liriopes]|uniref:Uncharacterized protein n=1 Tax=Colletotrichum liriopes TaxID=708192 RepID=A0AA37GRM8_9PEZI|nr:hypothetical protein ColLi_08748 [Colletotrichum liriopes]
MARGRPRCRRAVSRRPLTLGAWCSGAREARARLHTVFLSGRSNTIILPRVTTTRRSEHPNGPSASSTKAFRGMETPAGICSHDMGTRSRARVRGGPGHFRGMPSAGRRPIGPAANLSPKKNRVGQGARSCKTAAQLPCPSASPEHLAAQLVSSRLIRISGNPTQRRIDGITIRD